MASNSATACLGVNAGGYVGRETQIVVDPVTQKAKVVDVGQSLSGYNYGIRIDALAALMKARGLTP